MSKDAPLFFCSITNRAMSLVSVALSIRHYGTNIPSEQQDGLSQSVCGQKSFLFFHHRVSAARNHFCFSVTECLRPEIIFVFLSQSVCGRKSFLFFHRRVSATENHFCFFITGCQTTDANSLYRPYNIFRPVVRVRTDTGFVPTCGPSARVGLSIKPDSRNLYKTYT